MKFITKVLFTAGVCLATSVSLAEDCNKTRAEKRLDHLTEMLSLDDTQREQVANIMTSTRSAIDAAKSERNTALGAVLSEEQLATLQTFESKRERRTPPPRQ